MAENFRSILADLDINPDLMFEDPDKFQELCLAHAERLAAILQGKELPGDRLCREMIKAAAAKSSPLTDNVKTFKFDTSNYLDGSNWENEELAQIAAVLKELSEQVEAQLNDRLISGG